MKKPVISGWVLSFGSEKALLQAEIGRAHV